MASKLTDDLDLALLVSVMRSPLPVSFRAECRYKRPGFTLSGHVGEARLLRPGNGGKLHRRPLVHFRTGGRLKFAKPPYNREERDLIGWALRRLLDPAAALRPANKDGSAMRLYIFGAERPIVERLRWTVTLPEAELPSSLNRVTRDLEGPAPPTPSPSPSDAAGVLF